jgi:transposase
LAQRARIVLLAADGVGTNDIGRLVGVSKPTVIAWKRRYGTEGIGGLDDRPKPGRPQVIDEAAIVVATLEAPPEHLGVTHWSSRLLGAQLGLSHVTIVKVWRKWNLQPWRTETFKFSTDPELEAKVRDVVGLYLHPPEKAIVLCVDEKSQIQALDRTAPCLPMLPTTPARMTHDYVRNGTTSLFAALDLASGSVIAQPYRRHRHQEFLRFLKLIDAAVPRDLDLHLVLDNYATHKTPAIHQWLLKHPRFHLHFTPTSSSWLNLVERWFAELTNRKLRRSAHRSVTELETDIRKWINEWNKDPRPFVWTKTADEILETLATYCERISDSGH